MKLDAKNNESIRGFENWVKGELYGPRKEAERDNQMQCLTCGMMNIDPLSHTHTKETQPMSDTLQEREDEMSDDGSKEWCDDCHGYTHMPWCPAYEPAVDDRELYMQPPTNEHQPAARSGGESQLQPGMNLTCLRCFNDGWDAHRRGLHPANFHAGFATQDAPHTCNQHQSLVAERERLRQAIEVAIHNLNAGNDPKFLADYLQLTLNQKGGPQ